MTDETPRPPIPQPDLSQQQNPKAQTPPPSVTPDQVRSASDGGERSSGGGLQKIVAYFESQGAPPDQVIATIAGMPLKLSDLKASSSGSGSREQAQPISNSPPPAQSSPPAQEDEFKP